MLLLAGRAAAEQDDEGMYFNSPPASRNNAQPVSGPRAAQAAPKSAPKSSPKSSHPAPQSGGFSGGVAELQDDEDEEDEEEEDLMDEVAAYQRQLRCADLGGGMKEAEAEDAAMEEEVCVYRV